MLSPDNRQLFVNALRPPEGYHFDRGIGTTFTLDLITLLIAPLSLALFDRDSIDEALHDPLILLEGLRRNANRITIFCQAGYISVPPKDNYLYRYLEDIVVEVKAPGGGIFHPKVWLLRYVSEDAPTIYRLLNLSRNLTFDRSWDLMMQIEGEVANRQVGFTRNRPLSDFIRVLPRLALREPNSRIQSDIDLLSEEVRKVGFLAPSGFEGYPSFYPSGIPGYRSYKFSQYISRLLVISPFLTRPFINQITKNGKDHVLVSNVTSIDDLSDFSRNRFGKLYVLDDLASSDPEDVDTLGDENENGEPQSLRDVELSGLHAKFFAMESGWDVKWLLGSANATDSAFRGQNVEFMVEIKGKRSRFGIDKILGDEDDDFSLLALLRPYPEPEERTEIDASKVNAENLAEHVRKWLIDSDLSLDVQVSSDSNFNLVLTREKEIPKPDGNYSIICWPVSKLITDAQPLDPSNITKPITFSGINAVRITPFIAFEVKARVENYEFTTRFVLNLPITGLPSNRDDLIISAIIEDQGQFLRYLRLLLAGEDPFTAGDEWLRISPNLQSSTQTWEDLDMPLLEDLIRALSRSPDQKIDRIAEIVEQLRRTPQGNEIIPEAFDALWDLIQEAREILR